MKRRDQGGGRHTLPGAEFCAIVELAPTITILAANLLDGCVGITATPLDVNAVVAQAFTRGATDLTFDLEVLKQKLLLLQKFLWLEMRTRSCSIFSV